MRKLFDRCPHDAAVTHGGRVLLGTCPACDKDVAAGILEALEPASVLDAMRAVVVASRARPVSEDDLANAAGFLEHMDPSDPLRRTLAESASAIFDR